MLWDSHSIASFHIITVNTVLTSLALDRQDQLSLRIGSELHINYDDRYLFKATRLDFRHLHTIQFRCIYRIKMVTVIVQSKLHPFLCVTHNYGWNFHHHHGHQINFFYSHLQTSLFHYTLPEDIKLLFSDPKTESAFVIIMCIFKKNTNQEGVCKANVSCSLSYLS